MSLIRQPQLPLQLQQLNEPPSESPQPIPISTRIPIPILIYTRELKLLIFQEDKGSGPTPAEGSQTLRLINYPGLPISESSPFLADRPPVQPPGKLVEKATDVMKDRAYEGWYVS